ncbi:MAG: glutamate--tRNA ligase [Candidatus Zixiibacteriota bacterium]|nr:MAG: glutamate--tRNA ligase [candidate division Zixibacteria bacterium]
MSKDSVRVRIAPSPSGYLHVGTARTAIFNWLFARQNNGKFIVRIEDTDVSRSRAELIEPILNALKWLGLDWDEGPYFQSKRLERYTFYIARLLESGHAYRCFRTPEELEQKRRELGKTREQKLDKDWLASSPEEEQQLLAKEIPFALRLRIPKGETSYNDLVLGRLTRQNEEIEDFVICRSDGRAVYNMAVVADDHEMGITHVIRGNDHITNTFKQIHIYRALGIEPPQFAHVPLILRPDRRKVSKRLGDKDVAEYGDEGILPEGLLNFLCLLGWSPKDDREYLPKDELIRIFKLENVNKANPIFNEEKLLALNREYIKNCPDNKLADLAAPLFVKAGLTTPQRLESERDYLTRVIGLLKERCSRLTDFISQGGYFFTDEFHYEDEAVKKHFNAESREFLRRLLSGFEAASPFTKESLENAVNSLAAQLRIKKSQLIHPTRLAVSGTSKGPGLYDLLETLGRDEVARRMRKAVAYLETHGE